MQHHWQRDLPEPHELAKQEAMYKFLYFLRDVGIRSAHEPAVKVWTNYVFICGQLTVGG